MSYRQKVSPIASKVSVITATLNCLDKIKVLAESILNQTNQDFVWIIADGGSTDGTCEFLRDLNLSNIDFKTGADSGIYDALNNALMRCNSEYYLVCGADDFLYTDAIEKIHDAIQRYHQSTDVNIFNFYVDKNDGVIKPRSVPIWFAGHKALVSEHSVGSVIKTNIHEEIGYYDVGFRIAADHDLLVKACIRGYRFQTVERSLGKYADSGISSTNVSEAMRESYLVQCRYFNNILQSLLYFIRRIRRLL